jgi:hypothetical protein
LLDLISIKIKAGASALAVLRSKEMGKTNRDRVRRSEPEELSFLADTLHDLIDLANDIRTQYTAHIADTTAHSAADTTNVVTEGSVTSLD